MEAAQYLKILLTDWHQNFTKWALFRNTLKVYQHFGLNGGQNSKWYKMEAAQYLRTLLTNWN